MRFFPNGIIPACAGSTKRFSSTEMPFRDHPRMCGEHFGSLIFSFTLTGSSPHVRGARVALPPAVFALVGSSPHVRGALFLMDISSIVTGIIPACAGSTPNVRRSPTHNRDHPRMCGEH